jgi:D-lactate dehydrogenase (cytochrome)
VPISRLAECIHATNEDIALSTIPIPLFGHVGDGNFHMVVLIDPADPLRWRRPSGSTTPS